MNHTRLKESPLEKVCRSSNLWLHTLTHSGERPYACGYCGEVFIQKVNLRKHETKHERLNHVITENTGLRESQARAAAANKNKNKPAVVVSSDHSE